MAEPGGLNLEAFKNTILAMMDELSTKQTENLNARIDELKESNKKQTESLENKLELQSENFRQDTIKIIESLKELNID